MELKYLKYKNKYLHNKNMKGGEEIMTEDNDWIYVDKDNKKITILVSVLNELNKFYSNDMLSYLKISKFNISRREIGMYLIPSIIEQYFNNKKYENQDNHVFIKEFNGNKISIIIDRTTIKGTFYNEYKYFIEVIYEINFMKIEQNNNNIFECDHNINTTEYKGKKLINGIIWQCYDQYKKIWHDISNNIFQKLDNLIEKFDDQNKITDMSIFLYKNTEASIVRERNYDFKTINSVLKKWGYIDNDIDRINSIGNVYKIFSNYFIQNDFNEDDKNTIDLLDYYFKKYYLSNYYLLIQRINECGNVSTFYLNNTYLVIKILETKTKRKTINHRLICNQILENPTST